MTRISWIVKGFVTLILAYTVTAFASASPSIINHNRAGLRHPSSSMKQMDFIRGHYVPHNHNAKRHIVNIPRGGGPLASTKLAELASTPSGLFNTALMALALTTATFKILQRSTDIQKSSNAKDKPDSVKSLQMRFLLVFWLLRCADWLQGPYFYEVYASKVFNGQQASLGLISKLFLTGFASTALFGPFVGRCSDQYGRKKGTIAFTILYALGAASTKSPVLSVLFLGRLLSGIGTSLLFSAPEAWLVGESQQSNDDPDGKYLGETFGMAYAGDSLVAIGAGQLAGAAASQRGPSGPFELSVGFLAIGGLLSSILWGENKAESTNGDDTKPSIKDAVEVIRNDPKIMLVGASQSLFEAAMYIFVLQWPPSITRAIGKAYGSGSTTPYGTVFSCFMACCLLGSTLYGQFAKMGVATEESTASMLTTAAIAMGTAATAAASPTAPLASLMAAFFIFEACVGFYFPSIGTLRSKYVPDSHRSVIMNLFGIPLNVLVVSVFLANQRLGVSGALSISTGALSLAALCMYKLRSMTQTKSATA